MKGPGILRGIAAAIVASLSAGFLTKVLPLVFTPSTSLTLVVSTLSLGYLLFLFRYSNIHRGRVLVLTTWFVISLAGWLLGVGMFWQLLSHLLLIWLVRSLYFHSSMLSALLDLVLIAMATGAGFWAVLQTSSLTTAVWSFFLCQALFSAIPEFTGKAKGDTTAQPINNDQFQSAYRIARQAVRKLSINQP